MANDRNTNKGIEPDPEDDPTAELELIGAKSQPGPDTSEIDDGDEDTFDFDRYERASELAAKSVAALKSEIRSHNQNISRLERDNTLLHARWSGLDKEIKAREELTEKLNGQLSETRETLAHTKILLGDTQAEAETLQTELNEKSSRLGSLEKEVQEFYETVESGQEIIGDLKSKVEEQRSTIEHLGAEKLSTDAQNDAILEELSTKDTRIKSLQDEISHSQKCSERQALSLSDSQNELRKALESNEKSRALFAEDRSLQKKEYQRQLANQEAGIAANVQEIKTLRQQMQRTENYADELRTKLQDAVASSNDDLRHREQLKASIESAAGQIRELQEQLEIETLIGTELREQNKEMQDGRDEELRQVRFELGCAEETIAGQETISEQLTSGLIDNQGYRQALELQLASANQDSNKAIKNLTRKLKKLERAKADMEREVENKDSAIAALLIEVASSSHSSGSTRENEYVIHEIDGAVSDRNTDDSVGENDRLARLLIGNIDDRELRFPLLRHRLTIGRTANNDIQLNADFISRRHAVIVTENKQTRIVDWGSKNGVFVNNSRIAEQILKDGDIVTFGTAEFRYEEQPTC